MTYAIAPDPNDPWTIEYGPDEPGPDASPQEVAAYLYDVELGQRFNPHDWYRVLTTREARRFCELSGYPWKQVSPILRRIRAVDYARHFGNPTADRTPGGIAVNAAVIGEIPESEFFWYRRRVAGGQGRDRDRENNMSRERHTPIVSETYMCRQ